MPVVQVTADPANAPKTAPCLVAGTAADHIQIGPTGGLVVAGGGNDIIRGSALRDTIMGDDGDDQIAGGLGDDHIDGGYGDDRIEGGDNGDLILGGPGDDTIYGEQAEDTSVHPGNDIIHGGSGVDTIDGGPGQDELYGGLEGDIIRGGDGDDTIIGAQGDDQLHGGASRDWLSGGAGDDVIHGGPGGDHIHPGLGRDASYGEDGNDVFIINSECELQPGEIIDGGLGADRVISPLTAEELSARGVELISIETVEQRWNGAVEPGEAIGSADVCRFQDPTVDILEVSGVVTDSDVVWLDSNDVLQQPDSQQPGPKRIFTRYLLTVDTVYAGTTTAGQTVPILLAGGKLRLEDGRSMTQSACCFTRLEVGSRYRLVLREMNAPGGGRHGWEYEWLVESPPNHSLVLPLGERGSISMASTDLPEYYAPPCPSTPLPGTFRSNRQAIKWANSLGHRWDQATDLCGGAEPCMVAAPRAYMDRNMTTTDGCGDPDNFRFIYSDAARLISNGGIIEETWGVHPPGVATNPTSLRSCDTSQQEDGVSCIALDQPRPDLGGAPSQLPLGGYTGLSNVNARSTMRSLGWPTLEESRELDITFKHTMIYRDICSGPTEGILFSQVATHELGHVFGLAHVEDSCHVNMLESQKASWGSHERARFRVLYPSHEFEFPDNLYTR